MTKVLIVHDSFFYKDSNGYFYSVHINNEIVDRYLHLGNKVTFVGRIKHLKSDSHTKNLSILDSEKCNIVGFPNFKSISGFWKNYKQVKKSLAIEVARHDIIMPRIPSMLGSLSVQFAQEFNKPLIGEVVSCNWDAFWNYGWIGKIIAPYYYFKQRNVVSKLPYAIYVTESFLQNRYPNKGLSIHCSNVNISPVCETILDKRMERISGYKKSDIIKIGTIAAIDVPYKGQKYVIEALSKLQNKNFVYQVVGNGNPKNLERESRKRKVEHLVKVIGPLKNSQIPSFLDDIDIYIQPSKQEGLPRALIEAMSRGLPAIGSRTGGIPELLQEEYIFEKGSVNQLIDILEEFNHSKMKIEAKRNFINSKYYNNDNLNKIRFEFYHKFLLQNQLPLSNKVINES